MGGAPLLLIKRRECGGDGKSAAVKVAAVDESCWEWKSAAAAFDAMVVKSSSNICIWSPAIDSSDRGGFGSAFCTREEGATVDDDGRGMV